MKMCPSCVEFRNLLLLLLLLLATNICYIPPSPLPSHSHSLSPSLLITIDALLASFLFCVVRASPFDSQKMLYCIKLDALKYTYAYFYYIMMILSLSSPLKPIFVCYIYEFVLLYSHVIFYFMHYLNRFMTLSTQQLTRI